MTFIRIRLSNRFKRSPEADFISTYLRKHADMREIWKKIREKEANHTEADLIGEINLFLSSTIIGKFK